MSLTKKDISTIQGMFTIVSNEIQTLKLKFTHFETTIILRIDAVEQTLSSFEKTMHKRFNATDFVLKDIIEAVSMDENERYSDHDTRIRRLEQHTKIS